MTVCSCASPRPAFREDHRSHAVVDVSWGKGNARKSAETIAQSCGRTFEQTLAALEKPFEFGAGRPFSEHSNKEPKRENTACLTASSQQVVPGRRRCQSAFPLSVGRLQAFWPKNNPDVCAFSCGSPCVRLRKHSGEMVKMPTLPQVSALRSVPGERSKHRVYLSHADHRGAPAPAAGIDLARQGVPRRLQHGRECPTEPWRSRRRPLGDGRAASCARGRRRRILD